MSRDPLALDSPPPIRTARVLVFTPGTAGSLLPEALAGAGYKVDIARKASDLAGRLDPPAHDAIVLVLDVPATVDLPPGLAVVAKALGALKEAPVRARPALIVATIADGPLERDDLPADVWLAGCEVPHVVSEVRAALALRCLDRAVAEIEDLRNAVQFARNTAHDLAQPLTTILGRAQLLMGNIKPDHPLYRAVRVICQEAERLARTAEEFNKLKEMVSLPESRQA